MFPVLSRQNPTGEPQTKSCLIFFVKRARGVVYVRLSSIGTRYYTSTYTLSMHLFIQHILTYTCTYYILDSETVYYTPKSSCSSPLGWGFTIPSQVTAKGVRRLNSVQFEGYAPSAWATKLGRFRCMEMVNWQLGGLNVGRKWMYIPIIYPEKNYPNVGK